MYYQFPKLKFDKNRRRVKECPCGRSNKDGKFAPFVGYENKGKCHSCGESFLPELPKGINNYQKPFIPIIKKSPKPVSFVSSQIFKKSLTDYNQNNFVLLLNSLFDVETVNELISKYYLGTSKRWNGANVFWQIDKSGRIRSGKIMLYNPDTGKRVKKPRNLITWVHTHLKLPEFNFKQCFFGEHLLKDNSKPIAIVESEKTAIIASAYFPQFIWLATGGQGGLKPEKFKVLAGQKIYLFPDIKAFEKWNSDVKKIEKAIPEIKIIVSDFLEKNADEIGRKEKFDIADYLIKKDLKSFKKLQKRQKTNNPPIDSSNNES